MTEFGMSHWCKVKLTCGLSRVWGIGGRVGGENECLESIGAGGVRGSSTHDSNPHQHAGLSTILNPN